MAKSVHEPMILKMERICRGYIDQLENGGKPYNIQNFMMMYIFGACNNTKYRNEIFKYYHGYTNIDGLDPSQGLLDAADKKGLFKRTICCYVTPDEKCPIEDGTYDALLCSAGMFPGSIVPQAFKELIRMVKVGGILAWNIADGYVGFNDFFLSYDKIIEDHVTNGDWEYVMPVKKEENMLFEDAGYTYVMKRLK